MADGKPIEVKLLEVLLADATLMALVATDANSDKAVYVAHASPTGVRYPSIAFDWIEFKSEEKLPAGNGTLRFMITQDTKASGNYSTYVQIRERLKIILNRNEGQPLTEINMGANTGLRVVRLLRDKSDYGYHENVDKLYSMVSFDVVKSEDEDFSKNYGGWN